MYVRRNLARGYTAKELNVSFMREKKLQLENKVQSVKGHIAGKSHELQNKVESVKGRIADKSHELINKWEEKSREFIGNFLQMFGRDGRINQWLVESRLKVVRAISPPPSYGFGSSSNSQQTSSDDSDTSDDDSYHSSPPPAKRARSHGNGNHGIDDIDYHYSLSKESKKRTSPRMSFSTLF